MLKIFFGVDRKELRKPDDWFNFNYDEDWLKDDTVIRIFESIDNVKHLSGEVFMHEHYGAVTVSQLSGGAKGIIMMLKAKDEVIVAGSALGGNCVPVLAELCNAGEDIYMPLTYYMDVYPEWFNDGVLCLNDNTIMRTRDEFTAKYADYKGGFVYEWDSTC